MKLVLKAYFDKAANLNSILDFFEKDSRFSLRKTGDGVNIFALDYYTGIFFRDGQLVLEEDLLDSECEEDRGLLESNLINEIKIWTSEINSGDLSRLPDLVDGIFILKSIELKKDNHGYL